MSFAEDVQATISKSLLEVLESVSGDVPKICAETHGYTVGDWGAAQTAKATAMGAATAGLPVVGIALLPADVALVLRWMHRSATGIAHLLLGHADDETFADILAVWSGAVTLDNDLAKQVAAKAAATAGTNIGGQVGLKLSIKAFSMCTSAILAHKIGPIVAQKVASKIAAKLATKATTSWIPFISALAGGGINLWIMNGVAEAATQYCAFIKNSTPS